MVKKNRKIVSQKFNDFDAISCNELRKLMRKDVADETYMGALVKIISEKSRAKPNEELRLNDDVDEDEDDPDYMLILGKLKKHGNAYRAEYVEEDGPRAIIKYEEASSSDTECDQEQIDGPLNPMPLAEVQGILDSHLASSREEIKKLTKRKKRSKSNNEREENATLLSHSTYSRAPHTPAAKGDLDLDKNSGQQQYRRKLRSYNTKRVDEPINRVKEMEKVTRTDPLSKSKIGKEENVVVMEPVSHTYSRTRKKNKFKSEYGDEKIQLDPECYTRNRKGNKFKTECNEEKIQLDRDYHLWNKKLKLVNDHLIYTTGDIEVVYELKSGERDRMKEDDDDNESSDVEIIDIDTFRKMINRGTTGQSAFRDKVIAALRKPFDFDEYDQRLLDIEKPSLKERHLDLRNGRERSVGKPEPGKCYLDYHPALNKKLLQAEGDLPKKLNLLRGFFLWIEQPEEFSPWLDKECLAVRPGSG
ncbi:uncharacterized protein LOC121807104 isoform X2 [Salvia splendens]|uniref:uncharacterized protein LOC121807104 isoform X2 n=1 Tax=Salvia splendens TaxID=180675 RepID=UPI001C271BF1|nr:uncharacterized protein LOC121807104 isoform X2 [Salvia splendens]